MKPLSYWAKKHPAAARWIIAFGHVLTAINGLLLGMLLYLNELSLPRFAALGCMMVIGGAYLAYPFRDSRSGFFRYSYGRQKILDFVFVAASALLISTATRQFAEETPVRSIPPTTSSLIHPVVARGPAPQEQQIERPYQRTLKTSIRQQKQLIKQELSALKAEWKQTKAKGDRTAEKVLLIALSVVVALGLAILVAGLACGISCNGNEAVGATLLILGWAGIVLLSVVVIRKIIRMGRDKPPTTPGG